MKQMVHSNIHEAIEKRGYVKKWVADKIGTSPSQLSQWCKNKKGETTSTPHIGYVLRLCKLLDCEVGELFELIEVD